VSSVSSPGNPAPQYADVVPMVPELSGESNNYTYPATKRQEMSRESNDHTYPIFKRQEMPGESTPYLLGRWIGMRWKCSSEKIKSGCSYCLL
jgi:hypothetical protein